MIKQLTILFSTGVITASVMAGPASAAKHPASMGMNTTDRISYALGAQMGQSFKHQQIEVNATQFNRGMADALNGKTLQLDKGQMKQAIVDLQKRIRARFVETANANAAAGEAFLQKNKRRTDVVELESGLQYRVLKSGQGASPTDNDTVKVTYTGKLIDGTVFDTSDKVGHPVTFKVNQVISGWTQALKLMKPGATWELFIPAKLAYGPRGMGRVIGPNQTLLFTVHLLSVNTKDTETTT